MGLMFDIEKKHFKVTRIVYYAKDSQWGVLATEPLFDLTKEQSVLLNKYDNISLSGNFVGVFEGAELEVSGDIVDGKYGKAIQIRSIQIIHDNKSKEGVVNFLARSLIKGISVQNALKIYEAFGEKSIDTVMERPRSLIVIKGIGQKTVEKVEESVLQYKRMKP